MKEFKVTFKTLTPLWTGDAWGRCDELKLTGLIGSLRWWFEALVRGLGGNACDPTSDKKCELNQKKFKKALREGKSIQNALSELICPACQLFGCTGWSRKFILHVLEKNGNLKTTPIQKNDEIIFEFIPLKQIYDEEWALLDLTLYFIAQCGALGGKSVLKPSDEEDRENKSYHQDFGLFEIVESELDTKLKIFKKEDLKRFVKDMTPKHINQEKYKWVSIKNFWCVDRKYLARQSIDRSSFNKVLGRNESKYHSSMNPSGKVSKWLAGQIGESKKIFSFKNPPRTFGFINPDIIDFEGIKRRLRDAWGEDNWKFLTGDEILDPLMKEVLEGLK